MNQKQSISEIKNNSYKSLLTYSYSSKNKLLALEELKSKKIISFISLHPTQMFSMKLVGFMDPFL